MSQITARLPDDIVRQAIELYLEDYADLSAAVAALKALRKLDAATRHRISERIDRLADDPRVGTRLKGEYRGL